MARELFKAILLLAACLPISVSANKACLIRGTGDLGIVIERAIGSVKVFDTSKYQELFKIEGLGDLSHASAVYSRDQRYAFIFGRDGGLTKIDLLCGTIDKRIVQSGNSIGGAISQDGSMVAVSNYKPGGVNVFSAETLDLIANLPAEYRPGQNSKVVGLVDAPGANFVYSLYDGSEIRILNLKQPQQPKLDIHKDIGIQPYDALITPDGRYYIAGLFGEDGLAMMDLWYPEKGVRRILPNYGKGKNKLPVYKMPHLEGWAMAGNNIFLPAVGQHQVLVVNKETWQQVGEIAVHSQPVFVVARPDGKQVWVNFAHPHNDTIQIIDTEKLAVVHEMKPGPGVLHMEFAARAHEVWLSVRDSDQIQIYDTESFQLKKTLAADKPSGIFFSARAHKIGL